MVTSLSKRSQLAKLLDGARITEALLRLRRMAPTPWLPILTYHRVHDASAGTLYDEGVIDSTPASFDEQMGTVARYFSPMAMDGLLAWFAGAPLPPNPIVVTFDDGYLDNYECALPILQKHGVPATFFMATHYLSERRLFWWDRINYLIKSSQREIIAMRYPNPVELPKARALKWALRIVKDTFALDLTRFLEELRVACDVEWNDDLERTLANQLLMTWDQVRALRRQGMDVQSHTRTHRVLQTLPAERLDEELRGSREDLEEELGEPVRAISYPVGKPISEKPAIREAVRRAGYQIGFSNASGVNHVHGHLDRYDMRRISIDVDVPHAMFRGMLALPYLSP
jgi:peptidoglycan/xylan/chitin deacetylase (PgdA/CDA1 family)